MTDLVGRLRAAANRGDNPYDDPPWWWDSPDKGGPAPILREAADAVERAEAIIRKVLVPEHEWEQHYVDLSGGVIDVRVDFTDDELAYLRSFE